MKLWGGRFEEQTDREVEIFSSSLADDSRLWAVDLKCSIAHARMLGATGVISPDEAEILVRGLIDLEADFLSGKLQVNPEAEDIHSDIEIKLSQKVGAVAGKLHTARSRNDQVATDTRLYLALEIEALTEEIIALQAYHLELAEKNTKTILPGFTHMQHAQPVSLAHHLLAYFWMYERDKQRFGESKKRILSLPLGSAALAGTGFPLDRKFVASELGFESVSENSLDAVSDRDFVIETLSNCSMLMMHLSRMCEELILWSTPEFAFVELSGHVTTGSSIMPQKKNPDVAELIRGRVGRVYGSLMGALTMMKALPLSYNRDMQEDKHLLFEGLDTTRACVRLMHLMIRHAEWKPENMLASLSGDSSNSTDLADDLVQKGLPFRQAHEVIGKIVNDCIKKNKKLEELTLSELKNFHSLFDQSSVQCLPHLQVMEARKSEGGTSSTSVLEQIKKAKSALV